MRSSFEQPHLHIKYQLDVGERFSIVATAERTVRCSGIPLPLSMSFLIPWKFSVRFVLDCRVTEQLPDEFVTIEGALREIQVSGRAGIAEFYGEASRGRIKKVQGLRHALLPVLSATGDSFRVKKSLYGDIEGVEGGEKIQRALGGLTMDQGLRWYGGLFPRQKNKKIWKQQDSFLMGSSFIGIPFPIRHHAGITYVYSHAGQEDFQGASFPALRVQLKLKGVKTESPFSFLSISSRGRGEGLIVADTEKGKIARSCRNAVFLLSIFQKHTKVPLGNLSVTLETDSWHE